MKSFFQFSEETFQDRALAREIAAVVLTYTDSTPTDTNAYIRLKQKDLYWHSLQLLLRQEFQKSVDTEFPGSDSSRLLQSYMAAAKHIVDSINGNVEKEKELQGDDAENISLDDLKNSLGVSKDNVKFKAGGQFRYEHALNEGQGMEALQYLSQLSGRNLTAFSLTPLNDKQYNQLYAVYQDILSKRPDYKRNLDYAWELIKAAYRQNKALD